MSEGGISRQMSASTCQGFMNCAFGSVSETSLSNFSSYHVFLVPGSACMSDVLWMVVVCWKHSRGPASLVCIWMLRRTPFPDELYPPHTDLLERLFVWFVSGLVYSVYS